MEVLLVLVDHIWRWRIKWVFRESGQTWTGRTSSVPRPRVQAGQFRVSPADLHVHRLSVITLMEILIMLPAVWAIAPDLYLFPSPGTHGPEFMAG